MKSRGKAEIYYKDKQLHVKILKSYHDRFIKPIADWTKNDALKFEVAFEGRATLQQFEPGGILRFELVELPTFTLVEEGNHVSRDQMNTLRGIERFIAWAQNGYKPKDDDLYWIHEEIVHRASKWVDNPVTGIKEPMRTSDPRMDTKTMSQLIQYALNELSEQDIPNQVMMNIGDDMHRLWDSWYRWRYEEHDPLFEDECKMTWEEYKESHPICELCGQPEKENDSLERAHIVTVGSRLDLFNAPWNWLRIHHSHHHLMHSDRDASFVGWNAIIAAYPFIKGKIDRAFALSEKN